MQELRKQRAKRQQTLRFGATQNRNAKSGVWTRRPHAGPQARYIQMAWSYVAFLLATLAGVSWPLWSRAPAQPLCHGGVAGFAPKCESVKASAGRGTSWPGITWPPH